MRAHCCLLFAAAIIAAATAHVCLVKPPQRGPMNTSRPGDPTCARTQWPCGGQPRPQPPYPIHYINQYYSGISVQFQQNANHYEVGWPGYLQLAYTTNPDPKSDDDFELIDLQVDTNYHQQLHQQNFNVNWMLPANFTECNPCTLQVRYVSHKPGLETFYQCTDIHIAHKQEDNAPASQTPASTPPQAPSPQSPTAPVPLSRHGVVTNRTASIAAALNYRKELLRRHPDFLADGVVLNGVLPSERD